MAIRYDIDKGVKRTKTKTRRLTLGLLTTGFALAAVSGSLGIALAHGDGWHPWKKNHKNVITIKPSDLALPPDLVTTQKSWYFFNDNTNVPSTAEVPGSYEFVTGIDSPPIGYGSLKFNTNAGERWNIATNQFAGKNLDDLDKLAMTVYRPSAGADASLFFNFDVDFDNSAPTGYQGRLVFVPDDNGTVNEDVWQKWDMDDGMWRWSGYAAAGNMWPDLNTDALRSWSDIVNAFPNAEVFNESFTGQALVRAGHPGPAGLEGYLDSVTINKKTYNFETDECVFVTHGNKYKLKNNCETTETILIPDGMVLDGRGHTITAVDPAGGHFLGAVVKNEGDQASVKNLKIKAGDLANVCDGGADRLRGILFDGASGEIKDVKIMGVNQGESGCQEGNGIEVRYFNPDGTDITTGPRHEVEVSHNRVYGYQKTGIITNGYLDAEVSHNKVGSADLSNFIAANSIQVGFGANSEVEHNWIEGNQWCGASNTVATAILVFLVDDIKVEHNHISGNSDVGIYLDYAGHAKVKNNKVKDQGTDCNVNSYDIGIGNYGAFGSTSQLKHNHIHGFTTPVEEF